jgi:predicted 2-oxoglutarate/Fe(II)-dependent dioxygenase YbiX|tara:strand:- start:83 stop:595 length:513 start_codon:yes stop_codon:yes gene_type:complete
MNIQKIILDNFVSKKHSELLKNYFDNNTHLCGGDREEIHKERNLHFHNIDNLEIKHVLLYYQNKLKFFIDHFFCDLVKAWNKPQICRWKINEFMDLHGDNENGIDNMKYSAVIYLNDNYEGGELKFENGELYKLKENSVIFFKSGIQNRHQVLKVIKGLRYTLPLWYEQL